MQWVQVIEEIKRDAMVKDLRKSKKSSKKIFWWKSSPCICFKFKNWQFFNEATKSEEYGEVPKKFYLFVNRVNMPNLMDFFNWQVSSRIRLKTHFSVKREHEKRFT